MPLLTTSKPIWETVTYPLGPGGLGWKTVRLEVWNGRSWSFLATATRHGDGAAICEAAHVASSIARPFDTVRALWWTGSKWYQDDPPMTLGALLKACADAGYYDAAQAQAVSGAPHVGDPPELAPVPLVPSFHWGPPPAPQAPNPNAVHPTAIQLGFEVWVGPTSGGAWVPAGTAWLPNHGGDAVERAAICEFLKGTNLRGDPWVRFTWQGQPISHGEAGGTRRLSEWFALSCTGVYPPAPTYPAYSRTLAWRGF